MLNIYVSNDNSPDEIYRMIIASGVAGAIIYHEDLTGDYVKESQQSIFQWYLLTETVKTKTFQVY